MSSVCNVFGWNHYKVKAVLEFVHLLQLHEFFFPRMPLQGEASVGLECSSFNSTATTVSHNTTKAGETKSLTLLPRPNMFCCITRTVWEEKLASLTKLFHPLLSIPYKLAAAGGKIQAF